MKRFSPRELGLLMLPVLAVGALGLWASMHSASPAKFEKLGLDFSIEAPTTLEAFRGADTVFVVKRKGTEAAKWSFNGAAPFLEVKTPGGIQTSRPNHRGVITWDHQLWGEQDSDNDTFRAALNTSVIPAGPLEFGIYFPMEKISPDAAPFNAPGLSGKWRIDRTKIAAPNLAATPRKPLNSLLAFQVITIQAAQPEFSAVMTGEAIFKIDAGATNGNTPFEMRLFTAQGGEDKPRLMKSKVPNQWKAKWTIFFDESKPIIRFSGRVSADNRWPLGFEIEPFNSKIPWKVAPKLKFKQFPVALPKP